ncbi:MAG: ATPase [Treponema sp.]|nr:ATPase [Treponema sp.]
MAKTSEMRLIDLMVLKQDISNVLLYLGKSGNFQFQSSLGQKNESAKSESRENDIYKRLEQARSFLRIDDSGLSIKDAELPTEEDFSAAEGFLQSLADLNKRDSEALDNCKRAEEAFKEASSFSNLKQSYSQLEHLSFLNLRVGKIDPSVLDELKFAVGGRAIIVPLGEDKSRVLAASSKKGRFALDTELQRYGFVPMEIPKDFKGIPDDVLVSLKAQKEAAQKAVQELAHEKHSFTESHKDKLLRLLASFSLGSQLRDTESLLESTQLVYRLTGWVPNADCMEMMKELGALTQDRISIRQYKPEEVPGVLAGHEKVPVKLTHGKFVSAFQRMIFSYGSPLYGTIDPTPFVAFFFTLLFGIMFGDAGQGLVFFLLGILMAKNVVKLGGWNKFAPIFIGIGTASMIMGLLTGEFFANESLLEPFERFVTGLFGEPRNQILPMMPQSNPESIKRMFMFFGFSIAVGFVINSTGIIINIVNSFLQRKYGKALFGKSGLAGAIFFWYVVLLAIRVAALGHSVALYDWIVIGVSLFFCAFGEPFIRLAEGERPVIENGLFAMVIEAVVELLETVITYLSNSISFLRVGAFALAHAVLGFIILTMTEMVGGVGGIAVTVLGNAIVVVLEGMIVAIQAIRLQYYEFFSKFFNETGSEFAPYKFEYKKAGANN